MGDLAETLWQEFAVETEEHLQAVEPILAAPDPQRLDRADIAQLFRSFHSIKGLARAMDVLGMESVAHQAENLLGLVREGRTPLTVELADLLLQSVDTLKGMRDAVAARRGDLAPDAELLARLGAAFEAAGGGDESAAPPSAAAAAIAASGVPLHEDPEMLGIFVEVVRTLGPELCAALADSIAARGAAAEAAEALAHAAEVMNFDALAAGFGGLRDVLRPLAYADELDELARQELVTRLGDIRLQIALLGELTGHDAGTAAFAAALAPRVGVEARRLASRLGGLTRLLHENAADGDRLAAEADAGAVAQAARGLRMILSGLSRDRAAELLLIVEDVGARLASGEVDPAAEIVGSIDQAVAAIGAAIDGSSGDLTDADADRLAGRLRGATASAAQIALLAGAGLAAGLHVPPELLAIMSDANLAVLQRGVGEDGLLPYEILIRLEADPEAARRWMAWLDGEARPITNRTVLRGQESWFEMLVLSPLEPAALIEVLRDIDPAHRCIQRVRRLTEAPGGEVVLDQSMPAAPAIAEGGRTVRPASAAPQNMIRVRGDLIEALLDDIGEFRGVVQGLRHLIRGIGGRAIMDRSRSFAARLTPELRGEFLALVRDARDRDRRLLETEETIAGMLSRLHRGALELRVVPVDAVFNRLPRLVRDLAQHQGKSVDLVLDGRDVRVDKSIVDALAEPLIHIVRNAVDHGLETPAERRAAGKPERGRLTVRAVQRGQEIRIEIGDDGRGLDAAAIRAKAIAQGLLNEASAALQPEDQVYRLIFAPGLSTAPTVTETSGRGVGMDVVLTTVRRLDGDVDIRSEPGRGTTFTLVLPVSAALQSALIVRVGDQSLAIPERYVIAVAEIETDAVRPVGSRRSILYRQAVLPLYGLGDLLGMTGPPVAAGRVLEPVVVATNGRQMIGIEVDAIEQRQELFLRDLDPRLAAYPGVGGASLLGDGRVVLVLDGEELIQLAAQGVGQPARAAAELAS